MKEKNRGEVRHFTEMVAQKQGWVLSQDKELYEDLVTGLMVNWNRYGYFLCPCRDSEGSREKDRPIICPCIYARSDIQEYGHCFCSLYWSTAFAQSGTPPQSIPDRHQQG
ncbi:MAG: ferredoxin:thioredoxin reductase [Treponemataceae bacterium]|nr:ferredoxin:thioredoxin reductase [Treponemataceae bacterium]